MSGNTNREAAPQCAADPIFVLIAVYRAHQAKYNAAPEESEEATLHYDAMYRAVGLIARTMPTTFQSLAASAALFAEMLKVEEIALGDKGGDAEAWLATFKAVGTGCQ